jgi:hypothetical protein
MSTQTFGQYGVSTIPSTPFVTYRTDFRVGRIDFQVRNYGINPVIIRAAESEVDGSLPANLVGNTLINPDGVVTFSVNSAKGIVQLLSGSGSGLLSSNVFVSANFLGSFYGGNISDMEDLTRSGFGPGQGSVGNAAQYDINGPETLGNPFPKPVRD